MDRRHPKRAPFVLGLTGPIACGKTTVGNLLLELGALARIDADSVVHALLAPNGSLVRPVGEAFGPEVLAPTGGIDRSALGRIVFADPSKLRQLEQLTHPAVRSEIRGRLHSLEGQPGVVVVDAVKLLQSELLPLMDTVWVVRCNPDEQMSRLVSSRNMTLEDASARIRAQPPFEHPSVSRVIDNNASLMQLRENVRSGWQDLRRNFPE